MGIFIIVIAPVLMQFRIKTLSTLVLKYNLIEIVLTK